MSSDARYLTSFPGTKSDLPTVFPETSGYYPIISSDDEQDEFGMPYMPDPQPSLAKRAGRAFRAFKEAVSARFTKPNVSGSVMVVPKAETPHATFEEFLSAKAQKGFSAKDKLAIRGIEFITAEGLGNKVKAFFALGGIGYFFAEKVTDSNREALITEARFYHECCKVQEAFQKFSKKPDTANYSGLKTAYEAVLATVDDKRKTSDTQFDDANTILNKQLLGKAEGTVGRALLDHEARAALTSQGGFTVDSIVETFSGQSFLDQIEEKHKQGYRSTPLSAEEQYVLGTALETTIQQEEITSLLDPEDLGTANILASYVRVYQELSKASTDNKLTNLQVVRMLSENEIPEGVVDRKIAGYNNLILAKLQNPELEIPMSQLPTSLQGDKFIQSLDQLAALYQAHNENVDSLPGLMVASKLAGEEVAKAERKLAAELTLKRTCTLTELAAVFGDNTSDDLPGAERFKLLMQRKADLEATLAQENQAIVAATARLEGLVGKEGTLIAEQKELAGELAELEAQTKETKAALDASIKAQQQLKGMKATEAVSDQELKSLDVLDRAYGQNFVAWTTKNQRYTAKRAELESKTGEITVAKAELKQLTTNAKGHALVDARDQTVAKLKEATAATLSLTHDEIAVLHAHKATEAFKGIAAKVATLRQSLQGHVATAQESAKKIQVATAGIQASSAELRDAGFAVDANGQIGEFKFAGFTSDFKQAMAKELEEEGPLSANVIRAVRLLGRTIDDIALRDDLNPSQHTAVERVARQNVASPVRSRSSSLGSTDTVVQIPVRGRSSTTPPPLVTPKMLDLTALFPV